MDSYSTYSCVWLLCSTLCLKDLCILFLVVIELSHWYIVFHFVHMPHVIYQFFANGEFLVLAITNNNILWAYTYMQFCWNIHRNGISGS